MIIKDMYSLERSKEFSVENREEVTVNLTLNKIPCDIDTLLNGKVLNHLGMPIPGATVKVFSLDYVPIEHTTTDSCGDFYFKNILPQGKYNVIATAEGYEVSKSYQVIIISHHNVSLNIKLCKDKTLALGKIYGGIRDEFGKCVADATVIITEYKNIEKIKVITKSNSDGEYLVWGLMSGQYWILVKKRDYVFPSEVSFIIEDGDIINLDLVVYKEKSARLGTISGKILSSGREVSGAIVALYKVDGDKHLLIKIIKTNDKGIYLFGNIDPGKYLVKCNKVYDEVVID